MAKSVVETTIELLGKLDPSVQKVMGQAQEAASKTGDAIGKALSAGFKVGVAAAGAFTTALVKIGTEYQAATGQISAATGATGAELEWRTSTATTTATAWRTWPTLWPLSPSR